MVENEVKLISSVSGKKYSYIRFNGWKHQGFEDSKVALMSSIISELEKKEKLGAQSGEILKKLWKNINWMTVAKTAGKTALGIATGTAPLCVVMIFCVFISLAVFLFACQLMGIFTTPEETEILNIGIGYLRVEGACYCGIGILFLLYGYFRGVERPKVSLVLTVISLGTRVLLTHVCAPFLVWEQSGGRYLWDGCWQILQVFFG